MSENKKDSPKHIAIIMDGNGRWAKKKHRPVSFGHKAGVETLGNIVRACENYKIEVLTLFAFSRENWARPKQEVTALMNLFSHYLKKEVENLHKNNVCIRFIGARVNFDKKLLKLIQHAEQLTKNNTALTVVMAADYSGDWDIAQACKAVTTQVLENKMCIDDINADVLKQFMCLADVPHPDLCIRTSGEYRISNFLLLQLAYSELYFTDVLWPDFTEQDFAAAIEEYFNRNRRFGKREQ